MGLRALRYNGSGPDRKPDAMLFQVEDFDLPEWAHDELRVQCAERAIGVEEFVKYLVCSHFRSLPSHAGAQFTAPL